MRSETDLRAAGQRAALQPVPTPPPLSHLQERANKHRTKRRVVGSGLAALALAAVSIPVALSVGSSSTTVQDVVAGAGQIAPAAQAEQPAQAAAAAAQDEDDKTEHGDVRIEVRAGDDLSLSIRVQSGDDAVAAADAAAAAAEETLDVEDGLTVWVTRSGDQTTVSSLVEPNEFVAVTGSADQLDKLIEVLRDGGGEWTGFSGFDWDHGDWGHGDFGFDLDFDGGSGAPNFEHFIEGRFGGDLSELEDFLNSLDRDIEGLDIDGFNIEDFDFEEFEQFFDRMGPERGGRDLDGLENFFENAMPQLEQFFENGEFRGNMGMWGKDFDGCISVQTDGDIQFEFPQGCSDS